MALLCGVFAFLALSQIRSTSATYDETSHLSSGLSYWKWDDYRLNPEHPPLIKKIATLPLLSSRVWPFDSAAPFDAGQPLGPTGTLARDAWNAAPTNPDAQWVFGHELLYGPRDEALGARGVTRPLDVSTVNPPSKAEFVNDTDGLLVRARIPILILGLSLGILIFLWARELYGFAGGILALALFCFDPNFIAHSGLVTTDVGLALFMFGTVYFFWRCCRRLTLANVVGACLFFGMALASKFTGIVLLPILALLGLWRVFADTDWSIAIQRPQSISGRLARGVAVTGIGVTMLLVGFVAIWSVYGFRYSAVKDPRQGSLPIESIIRHNSAVESLLDQFPSGPPESEIVKAEPTVPIRMRGEAILFAARLHALPEAYLSGLALAKSNALLRGSFLNGQISNRGFPTYFLWTFALKTPLPAILLIGAAIAMLVRSQKFSSELAFLLIPAGAYFVTALSSNLNLGQRHILPLYPFLYVFCGSLIAPWSQWSLVTRRVTASLTIGFIALSSQVVFSPVGNPAAIHPHYLAYFNELAGGPRGGAEHLVDSNLDWGQDLKGLKRWVDRRQISEPLYLYYFGMADPRYEQISHYNVMPGGYPLEPGGSIDKITTPSYLAISATNLKGVYVPPATQRQWKQILNQATLVDEVGYSILIYHLDKPRTLPDR